MNIYLFVESLSDSEKEELKNYFIKQEWAKVKEERDKNVARTTIEEFVNRNKMTLRLSNILLCNKYRMSSNGERIEDGYYFKFVDEICKREFLKIRNAGIKSWKEVEKLLIENNLPVH